MVNRAFAAIVLALLAYALVTSRSQAYYQPPASEQHHFASMSDGCDVVYFHGRDKSGQAYMTLMAAGTCSGDDKAALDACTRALPFEFTDPGQDWDDIQACPLGSDIDTAAGAQFWQDIYSAYGLYAQGI